MLGASGGFGGSRYNRKVRASAVAAEFEGTVTLVTGAARGIGAATVREVARRGGAVALHYHRDREAAERLAGELAPARVELFDGDLEAAETPAQLTAAVEARLGGLDYLVNNAAFTPRTRPAGGAPLLRTADEGAFDPALWDQVLHTNLRAPLQLALAASHLRAIVNVGSGDALKGDGSSSYFILSKGGFPALTRYLARRLAPAVRVNAVMPGLIATAEIASRGASFEPRRRAIVERTPMGRLGEPEEMAEAIVFLLAGNSFITGDVLFVDGGLNL